MKKELGNKDIISIIEACAIHKVSRLKSGDFELEFGQTAKPPDLGLATQTGLNEAHPFPVAALTEQEQKSAEKASLLQSEVQLREEQIAELLITDPERAEQMLSDGDLDDADDQHGDLE